MYRIRLIVILMVFFAAKPGYGQLTDSVFAVEEVEIVSDRLSLPEIRTGRHVSVISAGQIAAMPVNSVDEILRYLPFMEVQSRGPFGAQSDILMRGSTFNQVLVLVDGMRINDPLTGHFNSNIPVAMSEISRIEVFRGPASSIYGPDAVGGVVNILTKSFETGNDDEYFEGKAEAWFGQHNLRRSNSGVSIGRSKWKAGAGINYNKSDGHLLEYDSLFADFNILTASLSVSGKLGDRVRISMRTAADNRLFNARYFYTNSPYDQSREAVKRWWNQGRIRIRLDEANVISLVAGYQTTRDSFLFNPIFPANIHRTSYQNIQINHEYRPGKRFRLATGITADSRAIQSRDRGDHFHRHAGAYFIMSGEILDGISIGSGFRIDYDPNYGLELLPQLNLAYRTGILNFRGSAGRSIRSPDFTEMYISTGLEGPLSGGRNLGNPGLTSEEAWSLEAGIDAYLHSGITGRMTGFYRFGNNLIDYFLTPAEDIPENSTLIPGEYYFYSMNLGALDCGGIELELRGRHISPQKLELDWNLSYQGLRYRSDSAVVSKYLASNARNLVIGSAGIGWEGLLFRASGMYKSRDPYVAREINQELDASYMLWNLRIDKYFHKSSLQLSLQVNNLFDRDYSDFLGAKMPGRWISGGITWNFHR